MEITWMGQYFFCPLSNTTAILSICPGNRTGVDLHGTSIYAEDINWMLWMPKCSYLLKKRKKKPATKQKKKNKSFIISKYMRTMLFHLYQLYCFPQGLPISWVTHLLEDGYVCVGFSCVYLNCPCCLSVGRSCSQHSASRSCAFGMLANSIYVTCFRLGSLRRDY